MTEEARWPEAPRSTLQDSMQSSQLGPSRTGSFHSEGPTASPKVCTVPVFLVLEWPTMYMQSFQGLWLPCRLACNESEVH